MRPRERMSTPPPICIPDAADDPSPCVQGPASRKEPARGIDAPELVNPDSLTILRPERLNIGALLELGELGLDVSGIDRDAFHHHRACPAILFDLVERLDDLCALVQAADDPPGPGELAGSHLAADLQLEEGVFHAGDLAHPRPSAHNGGQHAVIGLAAAVDAVV